MLFEDELHKILIRFCSINKNTLQLIDNVTSLVEAKEIAKQALNNEQIEVRINY